MTKAKWVTLISCFLICGILFSRPVSAEERTPNDACHKICDYIVGMGRIFCGAPSSSGHNGCMAFFYENWFDCVTRCEIDFQDENTKWKKAKFIFGMISKLPKAKPKRQKPINLSCFKKCTTTLMKCFDACNRWVAFRTDNDRLEECRERCRDEYEFCSIICKCEAQGNSLQ